jgi:hypothetical protein
VLSFDGTNDVLSSSTLWPLTGDPAWSLFVVHTRTVTTSGYPLSWGVRTGTANVSVNDDSVGRWTHSGSSYVVTVVNTTTNVAQLVSATKPSGRVSMMTTYRSGTYSIGGFAGLGTGVPAVSAAALNIGLSINGPSYHSGLIAEVLIYSRALTDTEHRNVCLWLGARWGVTIP